MGKSKDLATGASYVDTSGDTMTGTLVAGTRLQVGDSSITQQYPTFGYVADFQASSGSQTFISISEPNQSTVGNTGLVIGEDANNTYIVQRGNKPVNIATSDTDRLIIDGSGRVTTPSQPHFYANRLGLNNEFRNGVINYNVVRDTASGWNTSNHQYTIPTTGVYHFGFNNIGHSGVNTSDQYNSLQFIRSGAVTEIARAYHSNDALHEQTNLSITYYLQANDLIQIHNAGGAVYSGYYNTFSISLLG